MHKENIQNEQHTQVKLGPMLSYKAINLKIIVTKTQQHVITKLAIRF